MSSSAAVPHNPKYVLRMYKNFLTLAKRLPPEKAVSAISSIRTGFREGGAETNVDRIADLLKVAESKLGYLKVVSPRRPKDASKQGGNTYLVKDGKVVPGSVSYDRSTLKTSNGICPQDLKRHQQLLRRQYFMDRK